MQRYKQWRWVALGVCLCLGATGAWATKPTAPIKLTLTSSAPPLPGAVVDLVLTATPKLDGAQLELDFAMPAGVVIVSGTPHWAGPATQETPQTLTLRVRIPTQGYHRVQGLATLRNGDVGFSAHQSLAVGNPPPETVRAPIAAGVISKSKGPQHEQVVEFPVK